MTKQTEQGAALPAKSNAALAIDAAEQMAVGAEQFIEACNALNFARGMGDAEMTEACEADETDTRCALRVLICEFRRHRAYAIADRYTDQAAVSTPEGYTSDGWTDVAQGLPEPQMPVLLDIGKKYPIRAMWVEAKTLPAGGDDDGFGEYDEADDEWYCPAGWYEWNEHEERHWSVSAKPLRWMALPARGAAPSATAPVVEPGAITAEWVTRMAKLEDGCAVEIGTAAQASPSLPPVQVGAEARPQLVEMDWSVEGMKPLDGMDYIMADYARTFGRTPDAFMAEIVAKTKQRLFVWWGAHREAIRAALAAQEPPPPEPKKFWYMRDNHTFRQLVGTPAEMVAQALEEFDAGHTYGSVFIRPGSFAAHAAGEARRDEFTREALTLLEAHAAVTPLDQPAATPARSANQGEAQ